MTMKRMVVAAILMTAMTQGAFTQTYYTGDGGAGITLVVYAPTGTGLSDSETWLLPLVQGSFNTDFSRYSAITVVDRQNLDAILAQQRESSWGEYSEEDYIRIGEMVNARYILTGTITKTPSGSFMVEFSVSDVEKGTREASYGPVSCSFLALENLSAARTAAVDLLGQLGVHLTEAARRELTAKADTRQIEFETAMSKGIEAQQRGQVVEALSWFFQAADFNPVSTEAATRLNILSRDISSGTMGENVRNDLQWYNQWKDRLGEANEFVADYLADPPAPSYLVLYTTDLQQGRINYKQGTVDVGGVTVHYLFDGTALETWTRQLQQVVKAVNEGLANTGRNQDWDLSPVQKGRKSQGFSFTLTVSLFNEWDDLLSGEEVRLQGRWTADTEQGFSYSLNSQGDSVTFRGVEADMITDKLSVRFTEINGEDAQTVAWANNISIVTGGDYLQWIVPQNLQASVAEGGEVTLSWQSAVPGLKYQVYCTTLEGEISAVGELVTGTSTTIPAQDLGETRYWWVSAVYSDELESGKSAATVTRIPPPLKVGSIGPGGGCVFYDKGNYSDGWRYLEAAPESTEFQASWNEAIRRCQEMTVNGLTDWRLPDKEELNLMYLNLQMNGLGGFQDSWYWSSSQDGSNYAWGQHFSNGTQNYLDVKYTTVWAWSIRTF